MKPEISRVAREHEYLVVTDRDSKVLLSTPKYNEAVKTANLFRRSGGEVTIFKALKG